MSARKILSFILSALLLSGCSAPKEMHEGQESIYHQGYEEGFIAGEKSGMVSEAKIHQAYTEGFKAGIAQAEEEEINSSIPTEVQLPDGFVYVSNVIPDVILEIRYYTTYNFVGERITGYEAPTAILTQEAAEALKEVSDELKGKGYRLKIYDAYRPQCAVDHFKKWAEEFDQTQMQDYFYPDIAKENLFEQGYISSHSGHSRGSTVDLTLFDMNTGTEVDMGGTFDYFGTQSHANCKDELTQQQIANRKLLRDTMVSHGFKGITTEWWHFTLKNEPYPSTYFDFPIAG